MGSSQSEYDRIGAANPAPKKETHQIQRQTKIQKEILWLQVTTILLFYNL